MKEYGKVRSTKQPEQKVIDDYSVWVAANITPVTEAGTDEQPGFTGYEYDLTQYTIAVDRGNAKVEQLYTTLHPAVLRSIRGIIHAAKQAKIPVGMCGESAADPLLIPLLMQFGLDEFSVSASSVLKTRKTISEWNREQVEQVAEQAMQLSTPQELDEYLHRACNHSL